MKKINIVIDTNVLLSGVRSRNGYSFKLLSIIDDERLEVNISVPLVVEYEDVLKRHSNKAGLSFSDIDDLIDYICLVGKKREIYYLWRPFLKDAKDDMILELAVESKSRYIVTFNKRDFIGTERFNVKVITPKELLRIIGEKE
jgi:putative PIN family toxin of toxin-antitoxin system